MGRRRGGRGGARWRRGGVVGARVCVRSTAPGGALARVSLRVNSEERDVWESMIGLFSALRPGQETKGRARTGSTRLDFATRVSFHPSVPPIVTFSIHGCGGPRGQKGGMSPVCEWRIGKPKAPSYLVSSRVCTSTHSLWLSKLHARLPVIAPTLHCRLPRRNACKRPGPRPRHRATASPGSVEAKEKKNY